MCLQPHNARRCYPFQESAGSGTRKSMLHHVAYVEEGGVAASEMVGGADAEGGVLHWHMEAPERDHFPAVGEVEVVEGCLLEV
jgi:hypothetical protein